MKPRPARKLAILASLAILSIAAAAFAHGWRETIQFLTAGTIYVDQLVPTGTAATATDRTGAAEVLTVAEVTASARTVWTFSHNGAVALTIPSAADVPPGTTVIIKRLVAASPITITPAAGTIAEGGATIDDLDQIGKGLVLEAVPELDDWVNTSWNLSGE